jgi:hypothetical protein
MPTSPLSRHPQPSIDEGARLSGSPVSRPGAAAIQPQSITPAPGSEIKIPAARSDQQLEQNDDSLNQRMDLQALL